MNHYYICLLAVIAIGCTTSEPETASSDQTSASAVETLDFDGQTWFLDHPPTVHGDVSRRAMNARAFTASNPNVRVIEFVGSNPATTLSEGVYKRILQRQVRSENSWISDGPGEIWLLDGSHGILNYANGELHGLKQNWHANGELQITETYVNGKLSGRSTGYYDDGQIAWTTDYLDDQRVTGESFDRQ